MKTMATHVPQLGTGYVAGIGELSGRRAPVIRTLVVDDTPDILELVSMFVSMDDRLELIGRATNGREAVEAVASLRPDLVVMDVQMPTMDGPTAAALIRQRFPQVSIVLMSACPSCFIDEQIRASGADTFIDKVDFVNVFPRVISRLTAPVTSECHTHA